MHFDEDTGRLLTNEKGWRMSRANTVAREGRWFYEVKIVKGVSQSGPQQSLTPQPHIRMGWARREAPLDAPVGFDGYSYGITDIRFETMHRSRSGKFFHPEKPTNKSKGASKAKPATVHKPAEVIEPDHVREGDVIGLELNLPSLFLHKKVVEGNYNPAVDIGDGFDEVLYPTVTSAVDPLAAAEKAAQDVIRDRIPVPYKGNMFFEQLEYQATKPMESYSDRAPQGNEVKPHPNHQDPSLRTLPHSSIRVYKNGKFVGTAFTDLMAFLPPASMPAPGTGARMGFDDGSLGYYPAVASFSNGIAELNFGPNFWCPPQEMKKPDKDIEMVGAEDIHGARKVPSGRQIRAIGERWKEQIAEDVLWDIVDEADFFVQDGGFSFTGETAAEAKIAGTSVARGMVDE